MPGLRTVPALARKARAACWHDLAARAERVARFTLFLHRPLAVTRAADGAMSGL